MLSFNNPRLQFLIEKRPQFPKRAVVTSGMPYGNKLLHCGHISTFTFSDMYARFLRDRIGYENVVYVSGTDCYGSPIMEGYRKLVESGKFSGSISEYIKDNHDKQAKVLKDYDISLNLFSASGIGASKEIHEQTSKDIFEKLMSVGSLSNLSTLQFYDEDKQMFLNGRQVIGKCPFEGCTSEKAYADECDFGHQYFPQELIDPISTLSGKKPILKSIGNWYFNLEDYVDILKEWIEFLEKNTPTRQYVTKEIKEFLKKPEMYIKKEYLDDVKKLELPPFTIKNDNKPSFTMIFDKLSMREQACEILNNAGVRFRTGKTLVPFRLTGNIEWGVPCPDTKELKNLTFWVWPESLWAPISFTKTYLKSIGKNDDEWKKFWCSKDAKVYQFIGEDNIYFYGPAQMALWLAMQGKNPTIDVPDGCLSIPQMVANKHTLFLGKKASSSSEVKPPMAHELLDYYTNEQLRSHFLSLNVGNNSASFMPKPFNKDAKEEDVDPVVKEGNLLTNVYNRALRTLFYTWQKDFNGVVPFGEVSENVLVEANTLILKYEKLMYENKIHMITYELDTYIRNLNKFLSKNIKENNEDINDEKQIIIDALHMVKIAMVLLHSIVPAGVENLAKFLKLNDKVFSWDNIDKPIYEFVENPQNYKPNYLEAKSDFFKKHPSQLDFE